MSDLADFILQRIAEDEAAARDCAKAYPGEWELYDRGHYAKVQAGGPTFRIVAEFEDQDGAQVLGLAWLGDALSHIQRNNPARVLAECEAKRGVLRLLGVAEDEFRRTHLGAADYADVARSGITRDALLRAAQYLALPYAAHPDFREAWRP